MDPFLGTVLLFALFAATHLGLASAPIRPALVRRVGPRGFVWLFACVAALTFSAAISHAALHLADGPPGLALGRFEVARALLVTAIVLGMALMAGSLVDYPRSPYGGRDDVREPRGLQRVTRHGFFVGLALFGVAHALLATTATGAVAMASLAAVALAGSALQDRKLLALRGGPHADFLARTSTLPFAAALAGRTRIVWRELPLLGMAIGVVLAFGLRAVHARLFDHGGVYVIAPVVGGAFFLLVSRSLADRRRGAPAATGAEV
jgi:uncharacterized membrane protein